jgi:hypothetical protein
MLLLAAAVLSFADVAEQAGVRFKLDHSPTPEKHLVETMAGGLAAFDFDGDGLTDLFFTNGAALPAMDKSAPRFWNRLYRNEGNWKFRDVTEAAGVKGAGYSMGAAAADFDNDGRVDLFVAGVYRNILYRNLGGGRFEDITAKSGLRSDRWSVTGGWSDFDNDGLLDLWVVNYSNFSTKNPRFCGDAALGLRVYCHPKYFEPVANQLYRNRGNGVFEDVSARTGISAHQGRGMGIVFGDYDGDGRMDAFITNDKLVNFLFHNTAAGRFEETALPAGVALLDSGMPISGMGADWRGSHLAITALAGETFPLFLAGPDGMFRDVTHASKLAVLSGKRSGFGIGWADFDNDGWPDLFTANSHVNDIEEKFEAFRYKEPNSLFRNRGDGTFADESAPFEHSVRAHRGAAFADFDNDGRIDIAVSALGEPAELWRNTTVGTGNWLRVVLQGKRSNRDGIGARITVGKQSAWLQTASSYSSSSHAGVHFGLGDAAGASLTIYWPSGSVQPLMVGQVNRLVVVIEEGMKN